MNVHFKIFQQDKCSQTLYKIDEEAMIDKYKIDEASGDCMAPSNYNTLLDNFTPCSRLEME